MRYCSQHEKSYFADCPECLARTREAARITRLIDRQPMPCCGRPDSDCDCTALSVEKEIEIDIRKRWAAIFKPEDLNLTPEQVFHDVNFLTFQLDRYQRAYAKAVWGEGGLE
jgi:hypothetical protein